jgi:alanine-synthesizing transaminase
MLETSQDFYRIQKLPPYVFAVINEMRAKARAAQIDIIDLGMGNPDGATPRVVVSKLVEAARNARNHRYSQSRGIPKLREEIAKRYQANYGVEIDPDTEAIVTIGAKDALAHLLFATVGPGDTVVSPNPAYPIHQYGVIMAEGNACMLPMPDADTFLNRLEDVYRSASPKPKLLLISFPHNPTTTCVDLDFMREIVRLAREHGTLIVHDFAYADLGFDGYTPPSILQVEGAKEVAVEIFSMSKSYNMAGVARGVLPGQPEDDRGAGAHQELPGLRRVPADSDRLDHRAAGMPGRDAQDPSHLPEAAGRAGARFAPRRMARGEAARHHVLWAPLPERFREGGSLEFSKLLLDKALVAVSPGIGFGPLGEGYVRFALVENEQRIRQATRAIGQFLKS